MGESSREMRFNLSPPPGTAKGRGESGRTTATAEETTSPSDFSQWLHAMKMVARLPGGMPPEFRRKLWLALADKYLKSKNVDWKKEEEKCFSEQWREDDEELGIQIVKDLHRTGSSLCSGPAGTLNQAKLKRILLGYARYNPEVGYCQGFNMLGALILQVMDKEEVESIKVMIYLVEGILPRGYFSGSLGGLQADMAVFRELMTSKLPRLAKHLQKLQGPVENAFEPPLTNVFTMQWFLTMFCTCLPMTCVLRVWDLVLIEGSDVLLRTALVLWSLLEERILSAKTADDFYCKMGSFSSELLNGHLIDSNGLIEKVVELGPVPDLQKMRDKHLYNISPFRDKKGLQLYYSDEEGDSDEDSQMAVATAWGLRLTRRGSAGLSSKTDGRERMALDISLLKKQYDRLRERQRQAHIILTSAVARQGTNPNSSSIQMNQLLIGRNAIVTNNGRRLGPPQGAVPPARKPSLSSNVKSSKLQSKPVRRGETLHWRDTELSKRRRGSVKWKDIKTPSQQATQDNRTTQLIDSAPSSRSSSSEPKSQRNSFKTHQRSDSSSYSEDSDGNSSTSTSLCDEDDREVGDKNLSSLEPSPIKKSKYSKKHSDGSHKNASGSTEKHHTTHIDSQIPFVQLTTVGSPLLSAEKTDLDSLEYTREDSETESNRIGYAGFVDDYSWPDINEPAKSTPLEDLKIDVTGDDMEFLSLPNTITSISQLSPIPDITTYINSSSISPLRTPISSFDYSNLVGSTDDPKDFNVNDEGVTNEYFERINIVERPTKLDLLYSLNEEDSIRNAFKTPEASPEESLANKDSTTEKVPPERNKHAAKEFDTEMPFTEEVDRKMKVLLEYSNQSSLSYIAEAKHEISSGLFKDKDLESNAPPPLTVPYTRKIDDLALSLPKVPASDVSEEKPLEDLEKLDEMPKQADILIHKTATLKTEDNSKGEIETEMRKNLGDKDKSLQNDNFEVSDIQADSCSGSLHIPTTENLETRFKALELTFEDRKDALSDTVSLRPKSVDLEKDPLPQSPRKLSEKLSSNLFDTKKKDCLDSEREKHPIDLIDNKKDTITVLYPLTAELSEKETDKMTTNKAQGANLAVEPGATEFEHTFPKDDIEHSKEEETNEIAAFESKEYLTVAEVQSKYKESPTTIQEEEPDKKQLDTMEEKGNVATPFFKENKGAQESEKDLKSETFSKSYSFVPNLDPQSRALSENTLNSDLVPIHFDGKEAAHQEKYSDLCKPAECENHDFRPTNDDVLINRSSKLIEIDINFDEVLPNSKPNIDLKPKDCEKSEKPKLRDTNKDDETRDKRKSNIPSTEDLESRFMALERQFSDKSISLQKDLPNPTDSKLRSPIKDNPKQSDIKSEIKISITENISPQDGVQPNTITESQKKAIPTTAALEERYEQLERKLSENSLIVTNTNQLEVSTKRKTPADNENPTPKSPSEQLTEPPYIRKRIPSTEDLENRFKALEIQKAIKSPTATTGSLLSPIGSSSSLPFPKTDDSSKVPSTEVLESRFKALETTNMSSDSAIPSTRDLESRFDALEQQKRASELKSKVKETKIELKIDSTPMTFSGLEERVHIPQQKDGADLKPLEETKEENKAKQKKLPSTLDLELRFDAFERAKQNMEGSSNDLELKSSKDIVNEGKKHSKHIPSTKDLETRFKILEENKSQQLDDKQLESIEKSISTKIPKKRPLSQHFEAEAMSSSFRKSGDTKRPLSQHFEGETMIPLFKKLGDTKRPLSQHFEGETMIPLFKQPEDMKRPLSQHFEGETMISLFKQPEDTKRPSSQHFEAEAMPSSFKQPEDAKEFPEPKISNPKDLQIMKYKPSTIDLTPTNSFEITHSLKRKELYKVESQSDETLTASDPTSTEFDTKIESRPTSCPEYNDTIDSNTVNTDRVLKIIEENSKILHRILKKTLADAGNIESNTQHKIIHPGITDSLLALGNIFPRSDETIYPSSGTKSHSSYRSCITLHSDDNISDRLASIKSTIKSIDTLCEEKSFRKDKCQKYIDSLFAHSKISTTIPLNPSIKVEDFEAMSTKNRQSKRELKKDISPRRRRDEEREEYESRVRRDTMSTSLDSSGLTSSCSLASYDVDKEVDRINHEKTIERPLSPYYDPGYELNNRSITPVVYIPTKLEIRHTTVTSTFYDRYLTEKQIEKTFPNSRKSPVSPTVTKSHLDISKYSSINSNDRSSKSAENSPSRRKDAGDHFRYDKSPSTKKKLNLSPTLNVTQNDLHIQSCDNILLRLQSSPNKKDIEPSLMVGYNTLQRNPPDLGINLGLYKDYVSDESTKS